MPKGYFLSAHRSPANPEKRQAYLDLAGPAILKSNGKILASTNEVDAHENGVSEQTVLVEFEKLILEKMENAQKELDFIKESLLRSNLSGTDSTQGALKTLEDGADTMEKESLSQLAGRQQKFISNLEKALIRIKNGTYGICKDSGKLIDKKRLRAVPHATQSIEAKLKRG